MAQDIESKSYDKETPIKNLFSNYLYFSNSHDFLSMTIFFSSSINESNEAKSYLSSLSVKYSRPNIEDSITNGDKDHLWMLDL